MPNEEKGTFTYTTELDDALSWELREGETLNQALIDAAEQSAAAELGEWFKAFDGASSSVRAFDDQISVTFDWNPADEPNATPPAAEDEDPIHARAWADDLTQFARVLSEQQGVGLTPTQEDQLARSYGITAEQVQGLVNDANNLVEQNLADEMDRTPEEVMELTERARNLFETTNGNTDRSNPDSFLSTLHRDIGNPDTYTLVGERTNILIKNPRDADQTFQVSIVGNEDGVILDVISTGDNSENLHTAGIAFNDH